MHRPVPPAACARRALQPPHASRTPAAKAAPACLVLALAAAGALAASGPVRAAAGGEAAGLSGSAGRTGPQPASDAPARPATGPRGAAASAASAETVVLYRSVMPNGRIVIGDRPEPGARRVETIGSLPGGDRTDVARARQEREYWRQRAEAFAARHAQRQRELDAERDERARYAERERALYAARVLAAPPIVYGAGFAAAHDRLGFAGLPVAGAYTTSPGAAGRNLGALGSTGLGLGAPFGILPGAGFGGLAPGVVGSGGFAPGASTGFIGSGFATSGR